MFFIVFYNKVLKKSSFLAFFGQGRGVDLGPQRVIFSNIHMPEKLNETNTLNPRHNALNLWHTVKPAYAYACLSIAVKEIRPMFVCLMHKP